MWVILKLATEWSESIFQLVVAARLEVLNIKPEIRVRINDFMFHPFKKVHLNELI